MSRSSPIAPPLRPSRLAQPRCCSRQACRPRRWRNPPSRPNVCPALQHIVDAPDFKQLHDEPAAQLPGVASADDCHANTHAYDCHWRAHWEADGVVNDPLEELGADIAACFPNVVHDVNTPTRQHFIVTKDDRRINVTASVQGQTNCVCASCAELCRSCVSLPTRHIRTAGIVTASHSSVLSVVPWTFRLHLVHGMATVLRMGRSRRRRCASD